MRGTFEFLAVHAPPFGLATSLHASIDVANGVARVEGVDQTITPPTLSFTREGGGKRMHILTFEVWYGWGAVGYGGGGVAGECAGDVGAFRRRDGMGSVTVSVATWLRAGRWTSRREGQLRRVVATQIEPCTSVERAMHNWWKVGKRASAEGAKEEKDVLVLFMLLSVENSLRRPSRSAFNVQPRRQRSVSQTLCGMLESQHSCGEDDGTHAHLLLPPHLRHTTPPRLPAQLLMQLQHAGPAHWCPTRYVVIPWQASTAQKSGPHFPEKCANRGPVDTFPPQQYLPALSVILGAPRTLSSGCHHFPIQLVLAPLPMLALLIGDCSHQHGSLLFQRDPANAPPLQQHPQPPNSSTSCALLPTRHAHFPHGRTPPALAIPRGWPCPPVPTRPLHRDSPSPSTLMH
ncbi:hypothetical protein BD779DRAFT_1477388 [Infundibulicybe gibba]|nr:hypothetical protein BD779DRAFT_1477388 [Infundibulicybe gibba]